MVHTLAFLLEGQLALLVVVLVLSPSPVLTTLFVQASQSVFAKPATREVFCALPPRSLTYFSLVLRHVGCSTVAGLLCAASLPVESVFAKSYW